MERPTQLIRAIGRACSPDLIHKTYQKDRPAEAHRTWGCCYIASEALYHLWGKQNGFSPRFLRFSKTAGHFYLMNRDGVVLDPTRRQFKGSGIQLTYRRGISVGFLTKAPSKRCRVLLDRINQKR